MDSDRADRELRVFEGLLADLAARAAEGERFTLYHCVRDDMDALTCLIEEAPLSSLQRIHYLLDRYEALLRAIAH